MFPYQIYQALADQRVSDLRAEARRHELITAARNASRGTAAPSSRLKDTAGRIRALLHVGKGARNGSTQAAGAGPMGCAA